jgi:hypothetical protein
MTNTNTNTNKSNAVKPVFRKQLPGGISAAVFQNVRDGRTYRSVNLQRSYRDRNGKWNRSSVYLDHADIPFMIEVLQGTWNYLNDHPIGAASSTEGEAEPVESTEASAEVLADVDA